MRVLNYSILFILCSSFLQVTTPTYKFKDTEFEVGATMTRRSISFSDECKTKLKTSKTLDSLYILLRDHLNLKIEIGVHAGKPCKTCVTCSPTQNAADAVRNFLIKKGISDKRLLAKAYGTSTPLVEETEDPKQKAKAQKINERIVFKIIYNKFGA